MIPIDDHSLANFAIPRSRRRGPYTSDDVTIMNLLSPHVTAALKLRTHLAGARRSASALEALFDGATDALVLLDDLGRVVYANRAAHTELVSGAHIAVRNGRLKAGRSIDAASLVLAIREARDVAGGRKAVPVSRVGGSDALRSSAITCFPLTPRVAEIALHEARASVLVVVAASAHRSSGASAVLRRLFKLTETEAKLAGLHGAGESLSEAASTLHMGIGTARAHLKHIFAKTGSSGKVNSWRWSSVTCRAGRLSRDEAGRSRMGRRRSCR